VATKIGRNEPCHCGSGEKYKRCHWDADRPGSGPTRTINFVASGEIPIAAVPGGEVYVVMTTNERVQRGPFRAVFTLCRPDAPMSREEVANYESVEGDSNVLLNMTKEKREGITIGLESPNAELIATAATNSYGRLARLEIANIRASDMHEARKTGSRAAHDLFSMMSLMDDAPIEIFQIDTIDAGGNREITARMPFSFGLLEREIFYGGELQRLAALYREGLTTRQSFYAFLCFYRILEAVAKLDAVDKVKLKEKGTKPTGLARTTTPKTDAEVYEWIREIVPPWYRWNTIAINNVAPPRARGKKLGYIRDTYLRPLRDSIAHGLLDESGLVDVDDPQIQDDVSYWLVYTRMMARRVLFARCLSDYFPKA
jgi:hypothetical protein